MTGPNRVRVPGARIDTTHRINFRWAGRDYTAHPGDTLASALLAHGVKCVARSFKYGRPRGIVGAGSEEPNALVQMGEGALTVPNVKATQAELYEGFSAMPTSGWPSLDVDLKAVLGMGSRFMPAGFYSKTFKWPRAWWPAYEAVIRKFAGFGSAPTEPDPEHYDHLHHHVDVVVVGAGACGLLAALQAGQAGLSTLVIDEQCEFGGWLLSDPYAQIDGRASAAYIRNMLQALEALPNVEMIPRCTAFGLYQQNLLQAVELMQDHLAPADRLAFLPRQRMHKIRARHIVLATGAIERPLVFGNNDLPGVMTVSAAQTYLNRYGVLVGKRIAIGGNNDLVYDAAVALASAGAEVTVADARHDAPVSTLPVGMKVLRGYGIARVSGRNAVSAAHLVRLQPGRDEIAGHGPRIAADVVLSSGGLSPTVHLFCHDGSRPAWDESANAFVLPSAGRPGIACAGSVTGAFELDAALRQTTTAMTAVLKTFGHQQPPIAPKVPRRVRHRARPIVRVPDGRPEGAGAKAFVDYQNDVTAADIALAVRENYHSIEHVKRYTALGFGTDQGKLSNVNGFVLTARALGRPVAEVGTTTYRPAYTPVSLGVLAGAMRGETFEPNRFSAIQASHVARGAEFEPVGQWQRPWYFPKKGEDLHAAVARECLAARNGVAVMDASTLGKIQIDGPDAREFLNRVYSNAWSQLAPGKCRYGLMLDENGMVMDDGVTACIEANQFYMTTTTGGAAKVLGWLERWHQTEWPELKVWMTTVTDHWSTIALVGPKARAVLAKLCGDVDLSAEAFKFMDWRAGSVAGLPARIFRVSFSGELSFEINVESGHGRHLWEAVMMAGAEHEITPYGTETMHVLRAEKGFIIVGQDTDGSMTPVDLAMGWALSMKKPYSFLGKRSLSRSDTQRPDRKQLVGLLPVDPQVVLPEGAQIVEHADAAPSAEGPATMLGHVTSSYHSAFLGRSIAMAVVGGGARREGQQLFAWARGKAVPVTVAASSVFVDPRESVKVFEIQSPQGVAVLSPEVAVPPARTASKDSVLESALHAFGLNARMRAPTAADGVIASELTHLGYLTLRGGPEDVGFMDAVAGVLGQRLPTAPMSLRSAEGVAVLWLSPDEWLVVCRRGARDMLVRQLGTALAGLHAQCVDSSGGYGMLRLAGPQHLRLLRHLGPYDFEKLGVGRCVGTVMSKTNVVVVRSDSVGVLMLFRRSFADYVWRLVERAAQPYGLCIAAPRLVADPIFTPLLPASA